MPLTTSEILALLTHNPTLCKIDLSGIDLTKISHKFSEFEHTNLQGANLSGLDLSNCKFYQVNLKGANLQGANLRKARFLNCNLNGTIFDKCDLTTVNINFFKGLAHAT